MLFVLTFLMLLNDGQRTLPSSIRFEDITSDADGQWITLTLMVNSAEDLLDGRTFYGCESDDNVSRSVCFRRIIDLDERFPHVLSVKLCVIHHLPGFFGDDVFDGFIEYRLENAVLLTR